MRYPLRRDPPLPPMRFPPRIEEWERKEDENKAARNYGGKPASRSKQKKVILSPFYQFSEQYKKDTDKLSQLENDLHQTI